MSQPYLFISGLKKLANRLKGNERVFIGIRPFGFHAGNAMALVVYPYLLCEEMERLGKPVKFSFYYSLNDWEPDVPFGPDRTKLPLNIWPKYRSLQYTRSAEDPELTVADYWQPIIERHVRMLKRHFKGITTTFYRNSDLKGSPEFKEMLLKTLSEPNALAELMQNEGGCERLLGSAEYAGAVCPTCKSTTGKTNLDLDGHIYHSCLSCFNLSSGNYDNFEFWWHHKPMWVARIKHLKIDLAISGGDHFSEGDFKIRQAALKFFDPQLEVPLMLFTPTLMSVDGIRMSKTKGNTLFGRIDKLIKRASTVDVPEFTISNDEYYDGVTNPKKYFSRF